MEPLNKATKPTREQIRNRMNEVPEAIKNLVGSEKLSKTLTHIMETYKLPADQIGILGDEINLTLLGFTSAEEFPKKIASQMGVSEESITRIVNDVNEKIFEGVQKHFKHPLELEGGAPEEPEEKKTEEKTRPTGPDPYREPIE